MNRIRQFTARDTASCLDIYQANVSQGFIPPQYAEEFEEQLTDPSIVTLVFTTEDRVLACGSVTCSQQEASAWLSFGLVHPDFQRRGIGSVMLLARMSLIEVAPERPCTVYLSATRHSRSFFFKNGFAWHGTETDQYGNEHETYCFPMTAPVSHSIRLTLQRSGVDFDAGLQVQPVEKLFDEPANTSPSAAANPACAPGLQSEALAGRTGER